MCVTRQTSFSEDDDENNISSLIVAIGKWDRVSLGGVVEGREQLYVR